MELLHNQIGGELLSGEGVCIILFVVISVVSFILAGVTIGKMAKTSVTAWVLFVINFLLIFGIATSMHFGSIYSGMALATVQFILYVAIFGIAQKTKVQTSALSELADIAKDNNLNEVTLQDRLSEAIGESMSETRGLYIATVVIIAATYLSGLGFSYLLRKN